MKKHLLLIAAVATLFAWSCNKDKDKPSDDKSKDPVETSTDPVVNDFNVYAVEQGGKKTNKIVLENNSKAMGYFDYAYGRTATGQNKSEVIVPGKGEIPIVFSGTDPTTFEKVEKNFTVTVEEITFEVPEIWSFLCGDGSKTWVFDVDASENGPWGDSGFRTEYEPWDPYWDDFNDLNTEDNGFWGEGSKLTFSLDGGAIISKTNSKGTETLKGTFSLDLSNPLYYVWNDWEPEPWPYWSVGTMHTTITIPGADDIWTDAAETSGPAYDYYIVNNPNDPDQLILAVYTSGDPIEENLDEHPNGDDWSWANVWMWLFKAEAE